MKIEPCTQIPFAIGQTVYLHDNIFPLVVKGFVFEHNTWKAEVALANDPDGNHWRFTLDVLHPSNPFETLMTKVFATQNKQFVGLIEGGKPCAAVPAKVGVQS